jgi:4-hydroxy-3-methylbut-2-enyl diphosphate reductase
MEVIQASHAGVCYGVQRALDAATAAMLDGEDVFTLGPLIHNPTVVRELEEHGVHAVDSVDDVDHGIVIIRSHGVEPSVVEALQTKDVYVVDATCPHVAKAQKAAAELAESCETVLVIGRASHPEVRGLCGHAAGKAVVVASADEIPEDIATPVGVVVQTTESTDKLDDVVGALEARGVKPEVRNTICSATRQRQEAAAKLASQVQAIVVIGGRNSSNTTHLFEICKQTCDRSFFVESADEIDPAWFEGVDKVGVTAGASTPASQIKAVVTVLEGL